MSYEKDKLDSYVSSASLTTALALYVTSNSLSAAISGINLAPYVTSNSLSAAVATDALTVRGTASVSATLSAGAVTVAGYPVGAVLLGQQNKTNATVIAYSGSWSDFCILELHTHFLSTQGFLPVSIYTDGGTTSVLSLPQVSSVTAGSVFAHVCKIVGGNGQSHKFIDMLGRTNNNAYFNNVSVTANTGFVNCLRMSITTTTSVVFSALYGWRKT